MTAHNYSSSRRYLNYSQIISLCITPRPSCTIFCLPIRIVNSPTTNEIHEQTCCSHSLIGTYTRIMCHTKDNFDRVSCMYIQSSFPAQKKTISPTDLYSFSQWRRISVQWRRNTIRIICHTALFMGPELIMEAVLETQYFGRAHYLNWKRDQITESLWVRNAR